MLEAFIYWTLNALGYRKFYFDLALERNIQLTAYEAWMFRPKYEKGTYREIACGWKFCGYGTDK